MGSKTNFLENKVLDHVLRNVGYTPASTVYVALFTADPGEAGSGTEVSGGSYARQAVTFTAASGGATENDADILFPVATAGWGTVTHFAIMDALTVGNALYYGAFSASRVINSGDQARIPVGTLDITED